MLIPTLLNAIRVDDILWQQRAMLTFYTVIKVIASRRLPPDRKFFEEVRLVVGYHCYCILKYHFDIKLCQLSSTNWGDLIFSPIIEQKYGDLGRVEYAIVM